MCSGTRGWVVESTPGSSGMDVSADLAFLFPLLGLQPLLTLLYFSPVWDSLSPFCIASLESWMQGNVQRKEVPWATNPRLDIPLFGFFLIGSTWLYQSSWDVGKKMATHKKGRFYHERWSSRLWWGLTSVSGKQTCFHENSFNPGRTASISLRVVPLLGSNF